MNHFLFFFFFQAEDGIRYLYVTGVQTCALPICRSVNIQLSPPEASRHPSYAIFRITPEALTSRSLARRPQFRISPGAWATGMLVCRRQDPWTRWHFVWRMV